MSMHGLNFLQLRHHDTSYMTPTIWNNISHHRPTHATLFNVNSNMTAIKNHKI